MQRLLRKRKIIVLGLLFLVFIGYFIVNKIFGFGIPCIFQKITGWYCPGCGITRMLFSMVRLDFYQAFRYNPLVFILLCLAITFELINGFYYTKTKKRIIIPEYVYYIIIGLLIVYMILRNIGLFSYLAPTEL